VDDKRPTSVYDIEDIALPAGIVRRTTQEIEDRNRYGVLYCYSL